jgi:hypothetical protein
VRYFGAVLGWGAEVCGDNVLLCGERKPSFSRGLGDVFSEMKLGRLAVELKPESNCFRRAQR